MASTLGSRGTKLHNYGDHGRAGQFRAGVSLHAHTHYSRETMVDLPAYIVKIPIVARCYERDLRIHREREGEWLDFSKGWWHPPVSPRTVFESESRQIEQRFDLLPFVSITDHDDPSAGLDLQLLYPHKRAPVSFEWTVPFGHGYFHLGVHNLPLGTASDWFQRLDRFRSLSGRETLGMLLDELNEQPDTLLVLNHPWWDLANIGRQEHARQLRRFLDEHACHVHALELNGYRSSRENSAVRVLAGTRGLPLVSGGDRHGCAPNALLNLTRARSFAEFAAEVRDGVSHVVFMPEYHEHLATRMFATAADVLRWYRSHPAGRRHWTERVSWDVEGRVRPLSSRWRNGGPLWVRAAVAMVHLTSNPVLLRCIRGVLETVEPARRERALPAPGHGSGMGALGLGKAN